MVFILVSVFFVSCYSILLFYYRKSWKAIPDFDYSAQNFQTLPFLSIIIAARNEEARIGDCIRSILQQSYPAHRYECIVVNDHSTDSTADIIMEFPQKRIRLLNLADYTGGRKLNSYKKKSIETALQVCRGEIIITTDADCLVPPHWLATIAACYAADDPVFIAAPVVLRVPESRFSFLAVFQALDFMTLQGITGASVSAGVHNMCNGANLSYKKEVFYKVGGFTGIDDIASGDDMLLMHKIQTAYPDRIRFLKSQEAIVQTYPESTVQGFLNQRIRWASKSDRYTDKKITGVLLLVYLLNVWMVVLGLWAIFFDGIWILFICSLGIKILAELYFLYPVADFFRQRKLLWWFIPSQPFHIVYTVLAGWLGKFGSYKWKDRKIK